MSDGKQPVQIMHNWLWVIIPATTNMVPLLSAYCKNCGNYYTEFLQTSGTTHWNQNASEFVPGYGYGNFSLAHVPKWGCVNPMEGL